MKLDKEKKSFNIGLQEATSSVMSRRKSQVHFYVPTEKYKKLKRIGIHQDKSIGDMFNDMLDKYLNENKDF